MDHNARPEEHERVIGWLLALVLAVAFGLRLWMALALPRYFDDHWVFNNIDTFLNGSLRPRHSLYGSLSYLPQALALAACEYLHSLTGIDALAVRGTYADGFSLGAFRIMRLFVIGYAMVSIYMIYLVGRRLFSPMVGLVAAAALAAYPQHLRSAVQLKPDMMALMFTVITLYWTVGAARNPRLSRFLLAGVGVGLATSAKYIGVAAALPLTVWALESGFRDRRRWAWLALAGLTSVATFFALNPFAGMVLRYGTRLVEGYGERAVAERSDRLVVLRSELEFLAVQHGWLLGFFLLLGAGLLVRQLSRPAESGERAAALLPLSLGLGYPALYALGMTLFRTHNLLPALAGTTLVCAYGTVRCGQWLLQRRPYARAATAVLLVGLLPGGFLLARPFHVAYNRIVPDTWTVAEKTLRARLAPLRTRHVAYEPAGVALELADGWRRPLKTVTPSLAALSPSLLDLTDAEVFPLSRTQGAQAAFYQDRRRRLAGSCVQEIRPRPFDSRGTPFVLLLHPWTPNGKAIPIGLASSGGPPGVLTARLPAGLAGNEVLSLELMRPPKEKGTTAVLLQPGGQSLPLRYAGHRRVWARFMTPRFRYAAGTAEVRIPVPPRVHPGRWQLRLWRWSQPQCL